MTLEKFNRLFKVSISSVVTHKQNVNEIKQTSMLEYGTLETNTGRPKYTVSSRQTNETKFTFRCETDEEFLAELAKKFNIKEIQQN